MYPKINPHDVEENHKNKSRNRTKTGLFSRLSSATELRTGLRNTFREMQAGFYDSGSIAGKVKREEEKRPFGIQQRKARDSQSERSSRPFSVRR
jgi:hypothetical protein